jgi:hypothetical protein
MQMKIGGLYKWKHEVQQLVYLGKYGSWHQFALTTAPEHIWCEVLTQDLHMLEAI